jgi:cyclic pyranopterin phosphate synthase
VIEMLRRTGGVTKGDVLETARIAGIQGAKRVPDIVPLAHPIVIDWIDVEAELTDDSVVLSTSVACTGRTGVEVEAMTAATTAALTVYDMCKAAGKGIEIVSIRLIEKTGGKSGDWRREE